MAKRYWTYLLASAGLALATVLPSGGIAGADTLPGTTALTGARGGTAAIHLSWTAAEHATGYHVETMDLTRPATGWTRMPGLVTGTSVDTSQLAAGTWHRWRVVPVNGTAEGTASAPMEFRTAGAVQYTRILALGDSYSAGTGNRDSAGRTCLRSPKAWPLLARTSTDPVPQFLACAGATTSSLRSSQLSAIPTGLTGRTLIELTIGGNDVGFASELRNCITSFTSCTRRESTLASRIDGLRPTLTQLYRDLRARVPGADVLVSGYPQLVTPSSPCSFAINSLFDTAERSMVVRLGTRLNNVIQAAATDAGVRTFTAGVVSRFGSIHAACGTQEWINQLVATYIESSFHPFEPGNSAYAAAVLATRTALGLTSTTRASL